MLTEIMIPKRCKDLMLPTRFLRLIVLYSNCMFRFILLMFVLSRMKLYRMTFHPGVGFGVVDYMRHQPVRQPCLKFNVTLCQKVYNSFASNYFNVCCVRQRHFE